MVIWLRQFKTLKDPRSQWSSFIISLFRWNSSDMRSLGHFIMFCYCGVEWVYVGVCVRELLFNEVRFRSRFPSCGSFSNHVKSVWLPIQTATDSLSVPCSVIYHHTLSLSLCFAIKQRNSFILLSDQNLGCPAKPHFIPEYNQSGVPFPLCGISLSLWTESPV